MVPGLRVRWPQSDTRRTSGGVFWLYGEIVRPCDDRLVVVKPDKGTQNRGLLLSSLEVLKPEDLGYYPDTVHEKTKRS